MVVGGWMTGGVPAERAELVFLCEGELALYSWKEFLLSLSWIAHTSILGV